VRQRVNIELCLSREVHVISFVIINKSDWKLNGALKGRKGGWHICMRDVTRRVVTFGDKVHCTRIAEFLHFVRPLLFETVRRFETRSVAVLRRKGGQAPTELRWTKGECWFSDLSAFHVRK